MIIATVITLGILIFFFETIMMLGQAAVEVTTNLVKGTYRSTQVMLGIKEKQYYYNSKYGVYENYPAYVYSSGYWREDKGDQKGIYIRNGGKYKNAGPARKWGYTSNSDQLRPKYELPSTITSSWYSLVEDKFYEAEIKVDFDRVTQFFKERGDAGNLNKDNMWKSFMIGVGPLGVTSVWLSDSYSQIEVGHGVGKEIDEQWDRVHKLRLVQFRKSEVKEHLEELSKKADLKELLANTQIIKTKIVENRQRFNYKMIVNGPVTVIEKEIFYLNGENRTIKWKNSGAKETKNDDHFFEMQSAPREVRIQWVNKSGKKAYKKINFNREEILSSLKN